MSALMSWGWLSPETLLVLVLSCEVGASHSEIQRFNEMRMVSHVVLNRIESERFRGEDEASIVLAPLQFSCVGDTHWNSLLAGSKTNQYPQFWPPILQTARLAWRSAQMERFEWEEDPTRGATMYFSPISMKRAWYNADMTMPKGWDRLDLLETTPEWVDSRRFRFFAFQDEYKKEKVSTPYEEIENVVGGWRCRISGSNRDVRADSPLPGTGVRLQAETPQRSRRFRFDPEGSDDS